MAITLCLLGLESIDLAIALAEAAELAGFSYAGCWSDLKSHDPAVKWLGLESNLTESLKNWQKAWFICGLEPGDARDKLIERWSHYINWTSVIHPSAVISPSATIGIGSFIDALIRVRPRQIIKPHSLITP